MRNRSSDRITGVRRRVCVLGKLDHEETTIKRQSTLQLAAMLQANQVSDWTIRASDQPNRSFLPVRKIGQQQTALTTSPRSQIVVQQSLWGRQLSQLEAIRSRIAASACNTQLDAVQIETYRIRKRRFKLEHPI